MPTLPAQRFTPIYTKVDWKLIKPQTRTLELSRQCKPAVSTVQKWQNANAQGMKDKTCEFYCMPSQSKTKHLLEVKAPDSSRKEDVEQVEWGIFASPRLWKLYRRARISNTLFNLTITNTIYYLITKKTICGIRQNPSNQYIGFMHFFLGNM